MLRYANPKLCPDCRTMLPVAPDSCPSCALPLRGPLVEELFQTLQHADTLLGRLRLEIPDAVTPAVAEQPTDSTRVADERPRRRTGIRTVSVPTILLSLGALCLIVAAITFLAVAWSLMGIGGRTGVLVGLTAAAAASGDWLARRGLRVAAESLTTVALGLVALDVSGAISAGWLGSPTFENSIILVSLGVAAIAAAMVARRRLFAPQVSVALGLWLAAFGTAESTDHELLVAFGAAAILAGVAVVGRAIGARVLEVSASVAASTWWLWLLLGGIEDAVTHPTLRGLWVDAHAVPLLGAALLLLLPLVLSPRRAGLARGSVAGAGSLVTLVFAMPVLDEGGTAVAAASLVALVAWSAAAFALPPTWRTATAGPLGLAAVPALGFSAVLFADAAGRLVTVGDPFEHPVLVRLADQDAVASPLLLLPLVVALLLAVWVLLPHALLPGVGARLAVVAAFATLVSYGVPLALPVALLALAGLAVAVTAGRRTAPVVVAVVVSVVAIGCALPSAGLTAAACAVAVAVGVLLLRAASPLPGLLVPAAAAGLIWSVAELADVAVDLRALPVLAVCGGLAIAIPRVETEGSAALAGLIASASSVAVATDQPTSLAIHLTVAGALVTLSSLVHPSRRLLAWPGGALLALATWVRLADLGVEVPEAYTLPSAVVLVVAALYRLWRTPGAASAALLPGLTLGTVPSLIWVLVDPVSPRAALLGLACLGLVLGGAQLRWSTPLAVGAVVGGLLVVREVAPYASELPQWVLIGLAGTILTVVGVTWEHRIMEMRRATAYLGRLR